MIAPFATLAFLLVLWLCALVIAGTVERSVPRIGDAVRRVTHPRKVSVVVNARPRRVALASRRLLRAQPRLRAAA